MFFMRLPTFLQNGAGIWLWALKVLPEKIMKLPLKKGPHAGKVFAKEDFEAGLAAYYHMRSWDSAGNPSVEKLAELGLESI